MSDKEGTQLTTKRRSSHAASKHDNSQIAVLRPTANDDEPTWRKYWLQQGQVWRMKPEIGADRQKYLEERRHRVLKEGIWFNPLTDIKLSRADIEWLLATHENGRGFVDWNDHEQRLRPGLDLSGFDLQEVDLSELPLANSFLSNAHMEKAKLYRAHLENADLSNSHLERTNLVNAFLESAILNRAHLESADLNDAHLEGAFLLEAHLEDAGLSGAHLEGAKLMNAHLEGANLSLCYFDIETNLTRITLYSQERGGVTLADVHWGNVDLSVVDNWSVLAVLGDEQLARQFKNNEKMPESKIVVSEFFKRAARAYRQLAVVLRNQGMDGEAAEFSYRAQLMQRFVLRRQGKIGKYLFSLLLWGLAGYGYRPGRSLGWYLTIILGFALAYHIFGGLTLFPPDAFVFSIMSFHGRGFFPSLSSETNLHNPLVMFAAFEAIFGLLIEISFIATFTQKYFGK